VCLYNFKKILFYVNILHRMLLFQYIAAIRINIPNEILCNAVLVMQKYLKKNSTNISFKIVFLCTNIFILSYIFHLISSKLC